METAVILLTLLLLGHIALSTFLFKDLFRKMEERTGLQIPISSLRDTDQRTKEEIEEDKQERMKKIREAQAFADYWGGREEELGIEDMEPLQRKESDRG